MSRSVFALALAVSLALLPGCTKKSDSAAPATAAKAESGGDSVSLAIWSNYLPQETQDRFTKETGIKLRVSNFASNEELLAKVQAGASGIDVAVPSDYMVDVMAKLGLLQPLDSAKIPNRAGLDPSLLKQSYDPENKFSLPYAWSTAGLAINRELFKGQMKSWKDLFTNKEIAGKFSLLDDVREVAGAALKMNGFSANTVATAELDKAKATLKEAKPRVKMYRSDTIDPLVNKEVVIAHSFSSDALKAADKTGGTIEYVIPEEGGTRAIDNVVILKSAANAAGAHKLIDFLLGKEANVAFVKTSFGGPVVLATREALPPKLKDNPALFPSPAVLGRLERIHDVGEATKLYDRLWTEVKAE